MSGNNNDEKNITYTAEYINEKSDILYIRKNNKKAVNELLKTDEWMDYIKNNAPESIYESCGLNYIF